MTDIELAKQLEALNEEIEKKKDVKLYEQYTKTVSVAPGIRVKFS